jgi:hypothetical protein
MRESKSVPPAGHYNANYGNFQTELYAQIRREAFGEDIGQNSWLTSDGMTREVCLRVSSGGRSCPRVLTLAECSGETGESDSSGVFAAREGRRTGCTLIAPRFQKCQLVSH